MAYWPTPDDVADDLVYWLLEPWHGRGEGIRVLEPSAGEGHLVRAIRQHLPEARITAVEPNAERAASLRSLPGVAVVTSTLERYLADVAATAASGAWKPFDLVVMNPPFALAGQREAWADHVLSIYRDAHLLAPGAAIGAVLPHILLTGKSKRVKAVRGLLDHDGGGMEACKKGAFNSTGAQVSTALARMYKPYDGDQ